MTDDMLVAMQRVTTDEEVVCFGQAVYQQLSTECSDDPLEETLSTVDAFCWVHSSNEQQHQHRLDILRQILSH